MNDSTKKLEESAAKLHSSLEDYITKLIDDGRIFSSRHWVGQKKVLAGEEIIRRATAGQEKHTNLETWNKIFKNL